MSRLSTPANSEKREDGGHSNSEIRQKRTDSDSQMREEDGDSDSPIFRSARWGKGGGGLHS